MIRYGAKINIVDSHGDNAFHWAARRGFGALITSMLKTSERFHGSASVRGILNSENNKLMKPLDVATNETTRILIQKHMATHGERKKERKKTVNRIKGGLMRAKMIGTLDTGNEERKKRYGDGDKGKKKKKKKGHHKKQLKSIHGSKHKGPETTDSKGLTSMASVSSLPEVKAPTHLLKKKPSYIAAVQKANKHHGDAGDGGVPDELVALMGDDFMGDFHYGVREF